MHRTVCVVLTGIVCLTGIVPAFCQDRGAPRGYLFFSHRNRPSPAAQARSDRSSVKPAKQAVGICCGHVDDPDFKASAPTSLPVSPIATDAATPRIEPTTWGEEFGLGYGYTDEGYYPGALSYGFGRPPRYPLHGYRSTYDWAGQRYSMHCYCADGYSPFHCPGYRGECYVPCWNDAGTLLIERHCGRGSPFDCFWHMGGYERPCRTTDCPNVCTGMPSWFSYGFPRGTAGDPTFHPHRPTGEGSPAEKYKDPYPPIPQTKPLPIPEDVRTAPLDSRPNTLDGKLKDVPSELPTPKPPK